MQYSMLLFTVNLDNAAKCIIRLQIKADWRVRNIQKSILKLWQYFHKNLRKISIVSKIIN